jgi:hypothetical protein
MNAMDHDVRNVICAAQKSDLVEAIHKLAPGYMPVDSSGMADMGECLNYSCNSADECFLRRRRIISSVSNTYPWRPLN